MFLSLMGLKLGTQPLQPLQHGTLGIIRAKAMLRHQRLISIDRVWHGRKITRMLRKT